MYSETANQVVFFFNVTIKISLEDQNYLATLQQSQIAGGGGWRVVDAGGNKGVVTSFHLLHFCLFIC